MQKCRHVLANSTTHLVIIAHILSGPHSTPCRGKCLHFPIQCEPISVCSVVEVKCSIFSPPRWFAELPTSVSLHVNVLQCLGSPVVSVSEACLQTLPLHLYVNAPWEITVLAQISPSHSSYSTCFLLSVWLFFTEYILCVNEWQWSVPVIIYLHLCHHCDCLQVFTLMADGKSDGSEAGTTRFNHQATPTCSRA